MEFHVSGFHVSGFHQSNLSTELTMLMALEAHIEMYGGCSWVSVSPSQSLPEFQWFWLCAILLRITGCRSILVLVTLALYQGYKVSTPASCFVIEWRKNFVNIYIYLKIISLEFVFALWLAKKKKIWDVCALNFFYFAWAILCPITMNFSLLPNFWGIYGKKAKTCLKLCDSKSKILLCLFFQRGLGKRTGGK